MLVISVRPGETTTITTPSGDIISVLLLENRTRNGDTCLGIAAPESYSILRAPLRNKMLAQLKDIALYRVSSPLQRDEIIAVNEADDAVELYKKRYPDSREIRATRVEVVHGQRWYAQLEKCLLLQMQPPFFVEMDG